MSEVSAFHTFPRRDHGLDRALDVLRSIVDCGLLLTPEVTEWTEAVVGGGRSEPILLQQKRCCFTVMPDDELPDHMDRFGPFSIRFNLRMLRRLGGIPVAYLPRSSQGFEGHSGLGEALVARLADIGLVLQQLADLENQGQGIVHAPPGRSMNDLLNALHGFSGFIYMANRTDDDLIEYFRQREWRIVANVLEADRAPLVLELCDDCRARVRDLDPKFFEAGLALKSGPRARIEMTSSIRTVDGQHVLSMAEELLVPPEAVDQATAVLDDAGIALPVVAVDAR